jgi:hypothetical protein
MKEQLGFNTSQQLIHYLSHRMLIEEKALKHWIDNFYGYGSWDARFWFIGYEEGGGDLPEEVAEKINYFLRTQGSANPRLCDVRELYKEVAFRYEGPKAELFSTLYEYRFGKNALLNGVWKNLVVFEHGYQNKDVPDPLAHQKKSFVSPSKKNEALIQLYPLPSPHNHAWYYAWLDLPQFTFLKSRALYEEHLYTVRVNTILKKISEHKPELVLMYGMNNINALKQSVLEFFDGAKFQMIKAVKLHTPQCHRADINGTTLLITTQIPALRHNRIETGFDWQEFGKTVRAWGK